MTKTELKKALQDHKELCDHVINLDLHNLTIASNNIKDTVGNLIHIQDQLLEGIVDFHTFFEIFFEKYKDANSPDRAVMYKELSFLYSNLDSLMTFVTQIANSK